MVDKSLNIKQFFIQNSFTPKVEIIKRIWVHSWYCWEKKKPLMSRI